MWSAPAASAGAAIAGAVAIVEFFRSGGTRMVLTEQEAFPADYGNAGQHEVGTRRLLGPRAAEVQAPARN